MYLSKKFVVTGPTQFKLMLFKGPLNISAQMAQFWSKREPPHNCGQKGVFAVGTALR